MSLYNEIYKFFPIKTQDEEYRNNLAQILDSYGKLISEPQYGLIADICKQTKKNIKKIKTIAASSYKGLPSTAFTQLNNLLKENNAILQWNNISPNNSFYRMRETDENKRFDYKDMFHIPIKLRRIVKTQRYSSPGYPCLYLGKSVYGCWEEMGRPHLNNCWISHLNNNEDIELLDLRIPTEATFNNKRDEYIKLFPLIIACMIPVKNTKDIYKPEYIIPQLILEHIIKGEKIGIIYTSVHRDSHNFDYPFECYENIVIPIKNPLNTKDDNDKKLAQLFTITDPANNELEKLKEGYNIDGGLINLQDEDLKKQNYENSDFGQLEKRLKDLAKYPLNRLP